MHETHFQMVHKTVLLTVRVNEPLNLSDLYRCRMYLYHDYSFQFPFSQTPFFQSNKSVLDKLQAPAYNEQLLLHL